MDAKEYYLGLDMGTSSVGWAVTDQNYNILRAKGKDLWGIREFDEAVTAVDRRTNRISRRRRQRELVRIGLLKEYFSDAVHKKDQYFYQRLENSKYYIEDKDEEVRIKYNLFNDEDYTDKNYYEEYPTIFHLRKELINNESEHDARLVFLALLNMFKHRGHFLNMSLSGEGSSKSIQEVYERFTSLVEEEINVLFDKEVNTENLEEILGNTEYSRSHKVELLSELLQVELTDKKRVAFIKILCGLKVNVKLLFDDLDIEDDKKIDICFSEYGYEEKTPELMESLGDNYYSIIEVMKELYDIGALAGIMKGYQYLSEARVAEYEKHGQDLKVLKTVMKRYASKDEYDKMFRTQDAGTYSAYVHSGNTHKKYRRDMKDASIEDLYKSIRKCLKGMPQDDKNVSYIVDEMDKGVFLPKQLTASNGIIPNQVHVKEMRKILSNAEKYLDFLTEKDESGLTVSERILQLFSFQIPYYIGPVSKNSKTGWVVRKESGAVLPWNFETKIDIKKTSEEFISRLVRRCTYINGETVLPKASLEYESFCVLNEINNIRINNEKISVDLKQNIYNTLFKKGKKVTRKQLVKFLSDLGILEDETQLSGIDITINNSLSTYGKFRAVLGDKIEEDYYKRMVGDIVFWATVHGDTKKMILDEIKEHYPNALTSEQIKRILGFKFSDWGKLSKAFLELPGCEKAVGECVSLIRMMWEKNENLMEILNNPEYTYKDELLAKQTNALKTLSDIEAEDLDEYYFSAPVKRMVWQTVQIIRELEEVLGAPPKRLFVEMTRKHDDIKQRTISRKQKFLDLYKKIRDESRDWKGEIERADSEGRLRSKKMYLYLTQKGRCMYTGEPIDLGDLFNDNLYDIDHIYPRHYVKDDNIDNNLVLVKKKENAHKSDIYPLEESIYRCQKSLWQELLRFNLITEEKYRRLTGRNSFTDEQKADFIARQLVETSQGTKGVTDILKQVLPETQIVYSKASNVSEFRQNRKLYKCRSINDFHHAQDAYLNIVVGNVYFVKFTQNPLNFIKNEYSKERKKHEYNLSKMFDRDVMRGNEVAWIGQKENGNSGTIATVIGMLSKNTPLMTRLNFEGHGGIVNATLYSAKKATEELYIPLKQSDSKLQDVTKYGGFTGVSAAYFFLVEHDLKKKRVRTLEVVPIYLKEKIEQTPDGLLEYCREKLGLVNPSIRMPKIKIQSLLKKDGYYVHLSGKSGNQIILRNAVNLRMNLELNQYIKKIEKSVENDYLSEGITKEQNIDLYKTIMSKHLNGIFAKRPNAVGGKLEKAYELFMSLDIEKQCKVLLQIIKLTKIGADAYGDLTVLKESVSTGKMYLPKKISDLGEVFLINQSVTGLYENRTDLLKV